MRSVQTRHSPFTSTSLDYLKNFSHFVPDANSEVSRMAVRVGLELLDLPQSRRLARAFTPRGQYFKPLESTGNTAQLYQEGQLDCSALRTILGNYKLESNHLLRPEVLKAFLSDTHGVDQEPFVNGVTQLLNSAIVEWIFVNGEWVQGIRVDRLEEFYKGDLFDSILLGEVPDYTLVADVPLSLDETRHELLNVERQVRHHPYLIAAKVREVQDGVERIDFRDRMTIVRFLPDYEFDYHADREVSADGNQIAYSADAGPIQVEHRFFLESLEAGKTRVVDQVWMRGSWILLGWSIKRALFAHKAMLASIANNALG